MRTPLSAAALLLLLAPASDHAEEIWFRPRTPDDSITPATDWNLPFHPWSEWDQFAGQIQVFLASAALFLITPDDQLQTLAVNAAHGVGGKFRVIYNSDGDAPTDEVWDTDMAPIAATVTAASGSFAAALPENTHWRQRWSSLYYIGTPTLRAAYAGQP
ncbi:MAG: hypothetical protein ABSC95_24970 [Acetobacteraceae bacterium]